MNKYCFCVVKNFEMIQNKMENYGLKIIRYNDIAMIVEDISIDPELLIPTSEDLLKHEETMEKIMQEVQLIPMRFGVIANEEEIIGILQKNYNEFIRLFKKLTNRLELGLKIFWTEESFKNEIEDQDVRELKDKLIKQVNLTEIELAAIGQLVHEKIENKRSEYTDLIFNKLDKLSLESKLNNAHIPKMILNSAFLIDENKKETFDKIIDELSDKYKDTLVFKYTGPWPPYNFIDGTFS